MNLIQRIFVKYTDKQAYAVYKQTRRDHYLLEKIRQVNSEPVNLVYKPDYSFKHSGNCGDIIYSLPAMLALADQTQDSGIRLYLRTNQKAPHLGTAKHPLGNVTLNEYMVRMIKPLLLSQKKICTCEIYSDQAIDYDLDKIREYPFLYDRGNIARWYFLIFPVSYDLSSQWLFIEPSSITRNSIVIARSSRYQMPYIDYSFLSNYPEVCFVGLAEEYLEMKKQVPALRFLETNNFYELATLISGSRLFIGNQSFPFSIAEALKVNRLLEVCYKIPNVIVSGMNGFDFCFQNQFEYLVKTRYEKGGEE
jgi:hypothetical protein